MKFLCDLLCPRFPDACRAPLRQGTTGFAARLVKEYGGAEE
jgi:hypothetical protein